MGEETDSILGSEPRIAAVRLYAPGTGIGRRYEVRRFLGRGGSAVVYAAFDRDLGQEVALKILRRDRSTPASLRRFRREVTIARGAESPNLVRVYDIGESGETVFLVMELVEGVSLRERIAGGPLPATEALRIGCMVLEALKALHVLRIVHRDLKPGNILLADNGSVKVTDFGLARKWESDETRATSADAIVGTLEYLSPEQALGRDLDARSDLYSFGAVLFEMLTGSVPFRGESSLGLVLARLKEPAPEVTSLRPDVPAWLSRVVARLLEKDPAYRYASAAEVLADLRAGHAPAPRRRRRNPAIVSGALAVAALLGGGLALRAGRARLWQVLAEQGRPARAIDASGRVLWSRADLVSPGRVASFRTGRGDETKLAAVLAGGSPGEERLFLSILDPETGRTERRVPLPDGSVQFPNFSKLFRADSVRSFDLWGNGADAVVVTFLHSPYFPSYSVLHDPLTDQSRVVFAASGHHRFLEAVDFDGDGQKELLFWGPSNRFGYAVGFAAIKVPSRMGSWSFEPAVTPDATPHPAALGLTWYALGPRFTAAGGEPRINMTARVVEVPGPWGKERLGFDGFFREAAQPAPARNAARLRSFEHLREAQRLSGSGLGAEAVAEAGIAEVAAREANDDALLEWARRVHGVSLALAGRTAEAEVILDDLARSAAAPSEVELDAARALHLSGAVRRATVWYERALGVGASSSAGRPPSEALEGLVLALGELGRWGDALVQVGRFEAQYPTPAGTAFPSRAYIRWRSTGRGDAGLTDNPDGPDLYRYWSLELRAARDEDAQGLLRSLDGLAEAVPSVRGPLLSLRSEAVKVSRDPPGEGSNRRHPSRRRATTVDRCPGLGSEALLRLPGVRAAESIGLPGACVRLHAGTAVR